MTALAIQYADIEAAAARLASVAHRIPVLYSRTAGELTGAQVYFKAMSASPLVGVTQSAISGSARARTFGKKLREKVQPLAQHPLLGHVGRPGLPAEVRELVLHSNYIAFCRLLEASRTVEILRVKHVAQQTP